MPVTKPLPAKLLLRSLFIVPLFAGMIACRPGTGGQEHKSHAKTDSVRTPNHDVNEPAASNMCDATIIDENAFEIRNDQFIANALDKELGCAYIDSAFTGVKRSIKISKNRYSGEMTDTTASYKEGCDSVTYLSTKENCFPVYVSIQSNRMAFDNGAIRVGMTKDQFLNRLHAKKDPAPVIRITDLEDGNELIFIFTDNKLVRIVYNVLYVD